MTFLYAACRSLCRRRFFCKVGDQKLGARDGYGVWDVEKLNIKADSQTEVLLMEVPMTL